MLTPRAPLVSPSLLRKSGDTSGALGVNIVTHISQTDNLVIVLTSPKSLLSPDESDDISLETLVSE